MRKAYLGPDTDIRNSVLASKGLFYFNLFLSINFLFFSVKVLGCVLLIMFRNKNMKVLFKSRAVIFRPLERYILVHRLFFIIISSRFLDIALQ